MPPPSNRFDGKNIRELLPDEYPEFQYKPHKKFLRCHSHMDDPTDCNTKIWRCAYEPSVEDKNKWTGIVATCGGSVICIIDVASATVKVKLRQTEDQFYDVLWATTTIKLQQKQIKTNILLSAGSEGRLTFIHPACNKVFAHLSICPKTYISSLKLHPSNVDWIFCGTDHGKIILVDSGLTGSVDYKLNWKRLQEFSCNGTDCIHLLVPEPKLLIVACQKGCYAWSLNDPKKMTTSDTPQPNDAVLQFPVSQSDNYCDGLALLDKNTVAIKFSKSASILIWNLDQYKQKIKAGAGTIVITPQLVLPWTSTKEIYIDITARNGIVVAGDPQGAVIMYSLEKYLKDKGAYKDTPTPKCTLQWPDLKPDPSTEINKRLKGFNKPPLINHASLSPDMSSSPYKAKQTSESMIEKQAARGQEAKPKR